MGDPTFSWCSRRGYDLRGMPAGARACPECSADVSNNPRTIAAQIDAALTLIVRGLLVVGLAWSLAIAADLLLQIQGVSDYRALRPAWVLLALASLVPTIGLILLGRVMPVARAVTLIPIAFAAILLLAAGYLSVFRHTSGFYWYRLQAPGLPDRIGFIIGGAALLTGGAAAALLASLAERLGMPRLAAPLRRLALAGTIAAIVWLILCVVLQGFADSATAASQQVTTTLSPDGSITFIPGPQAAWFWQEGVQLFWVALYAWSAALIAGLWAAALVLRSHVHTLREPR